MFDLGLAMRKKEEFETARLLDFDFRRRARATRMLADWLALDNATAAHVMASVPESEVPERLATLTGVDVAVVRDRYAACIAQAHAALLIERGDPAPHRMA